MKEVVGRATQATTAWVAGVLERSGCTDAGDLAAVHCEPIGVGAGFFGKLARLRLTYSKVRPDAPESVILKLPSSSVSNRARGDLFSLQEREIGFYREIAPSICVRVPQCYWSRLDSSGDWGLLLEDFGALRTGDELSGLPPEHVKIAVEGAGRAHAQWWQSPALERLQWLPGENARVMRRLGEICRDLWPQFVDRHRDSLNPGAVALGEHVCDHLEDVLDEMARGPETLVHGDFRSDNLFFSEQTDVAFIDWQLCCRGSAAFDVAYLLSQSVTTRVRRRYEFHMLRHWYDVLLDAGVTGYSFRDAVNDYRRSLLLCVAYVVVGATLDRGTDRGRDLARAQVMRAFGAAVDLQADAVLGN
jgi:hypothetical protein